MVFYSVVVTWYLSFVTEMFLKISSGLCVCIFFRPRNIMRFEKYQVNCTEVPPPAAISPLSTTFSITFSTSNHQAKSLCLSMALRNHWTQVISTTCVHTQSHLNSEKPCLFLPLLLLLLLKLGWQMSQKMGQQMFEGFCSQVPEV